MKNSIKKLAPKFKKLTNELKNIWNLASLLAESLAATALLLVTVEYSDQLPKYALAAASSVLIVNVLAKLYTLNRR